MKYLKSVLVFLLVFLGSVGTLSAKSMQYTIVIPAQFEEAMMFSEGMAAVKQGGKWGYVNEQGQMIVSPQYDYAGTFSEGVGVVAKWIGNDDNGEFYEGDYYECGIVDQTGNYTPFITTDGEKYIHFQFVAAPPLSEYYLNRYSEGYTLIRTDQGYYSPVFNKQGQQIEIPRGAVGLFNYSDGLMPAIQDYSQFMYLDKTGKPALEINQNEYGYPDYIWPFNQGIAPVIWEDEDGTKAIGFINKQGEVIIKPTYLNFMVLKPQTEYIVFNEGFAVVQDINYKCGMIDQKGNTIIPFNYEDMRSYNEGLVPAKSNGKWGYVDQNNECIIDFQYDEALPFNEGFAYVEVGNEAYFIDTEGNKIEGSDIIAENQVLIDGTAFTALSLDLPFVIKENDKYGYAMLEIEESEPVDESLLEGFIERFYETCLMRTPDAEGIAYWKEAFKKRRFTGASMAHFFVTNEEFKNRNLSDTEYIETMYRVFFDRDADQGGISYWQSCLDQGITRNYILAGFINSDEFLALCKDFGISRGSIVLDDVIDTHPQVTQFVYRFYERCMNRKPDEAGLHYWVNGLVEQVYTGTSMAESFTNTPEFENQDLSDEEYLEVLYRMFFNREGDESGKAYWLGVIANGSTRKYVTQSFVYSNEFQGICETYGIRYC